MPGYTYTDKQIQGWPTAAAAAALRERAHYLETQLCYWKHRAESAEARMLAHDCEES